MYYGNVIDQYFLVTMIAKDSKVSAKLCLIHLVLVCIMLLFEKFILQQLSNEKVIILQFSMWIELILLKLCLKCMLSHIGSKSPKGGSRASSHERSSSAGSNMFVRANSLKAWKEEQDRIKAEEEEKERAASAKRAKSATKKVGGKGKNTLGKRWVKLGKVCNENDGC